ncbi:hypothetical protein GNY06_07860 [Elizabethkingia argentiflava]|uniref:Autotransporter domain-containing protein n=2 Tax=Elizabethkingia argenteiflava TaxID=2681556 RepID=A0A845PWQ5_9FLAO|nr:hypothetical protein [Elizabethkingia argenteiflava]
MKTRLFFTLIFSFIVLLFPAQKKKTIKDSSATTDKEVYHSHIMVGIDVLNLGLMAFTEDRRLQGFVSMHIHPKLYALADVGYEKNRYNKNGYNVLANGFFIKAGSVYMLSSDSHFLENGFYAGGKVAASFYQQDIKSIPIRGFQGYDSFESFPKSSQSSYWLEGAVGGRVSLLSSRFFIDLQLQPKYMIYTTKQEKIEPMAVPGFGTNSNKFKLGISWNLAYWF